MDKIYDHAIRLIRYLALVDMSFAAMDLTTNLGVVPTQEFSVHNSSYVSFLD